MPPDTCAMVTRGPRCATFCDAHSALLRKHFAADPLDPISNLDLLPRAEYPQSCRPHGVNVQCGPPPLTRRGKDLISDEEPTGLEHPARDARRTPRPSPRLETTIMKRWRRRASLETTRRPRPTGMSDSSTSNPIRETALSLASCDSREN